jgi:hypothetical protein
LKKCRLLALETLIGEKFPQSEKEKTSLKRKAKDIEKDTKKRKQI